MFGGPRGTTPPLPPPRVRPGRGCFAGREVIRVRYLPCRQDKSRMNTGRTKSLLPILLPTWPELCSNQGQDTVTRARGPSLAVPKKRGFRGWGCSVSCAEDDGPYS